MIISKMQKRASVGHVLKRESLEVANRRRTLIRAVGISRRGTITDIAGNQSYGEVKRCDQVHRKLCQPPNLLINQNASKEVEIRGGAKKT